MKTPLWMINSPFLDAFGRIPILDGRILIFDGRIPLSVDNIIFFEWSNHHFGW